MRAVDVAASAAARRLAIAARQFTGAERLARAIEALGRTPVLLVLDNLEDLSPAATRAWADFLGEPAEKKSIGQIAHLLQRFQQTLLPGKRRFSLDHQTDRIDFRQLASLIDESERLLQATVFSRTPGEWLQLLPLKRRKKRRPKHLRKPAPRSQLTVNVSLCLPWPGRWRKTKG